ncbi:transcriptional regulator [Listeria floridensis FSL S10-1187]|uniref:Transcriptional regulator n=1 Tax=Listeria floridensis FSL S10-1187 TaxID=1265817 RepID=A0ABN0RCG6_9LIST|nr:TetR/AcrR family transcriptional regulator [Listeria floridensis]EUJ26486.1 transcriptional regulator [Listeria floridensis FSL S10-1187]
MVKLSRKEELQRTRAKILTAGEALFMQKGYRAVSTREIAILAEVTQPALYHHFKDKEVLYMEVVKDLTLRIQIDMSEILLKKQDGILSLNEMVLNLIEKHPTNILLMIHDILNELQPENQRMLYGLWQESYLKPFEEVFLQMSDEQVWSSEFTPQEAAHYFMSAITPLFTPSLQVTQSGQKDKVAKRIHLILFGILKEEV